MEKSANMKYGEIKKAFEFLIFLILVYTFVIFLGFIFILLRLTGRIKVAGSENLKKSKRGTLIISNHGSIVDSIVIASLYFPWFLIHPLKGFLWNTPDKKNFLTYGISSWILRFLRMIPIDRDSKNPDRNKLAVEKIIQVLNRGQIVIIFPEGGRTQKQLVKRTSPLKGKEIGAFKHGVERIIQKCDCTVLPIWHEGTEKFCQ